MRESVVVRFSREIVDDKPTKNVFAQYTPENAVEVLTGVIAICRRCKQKGECSPSWNPQEGGMTIYQKNKIQDQLCPLIVYGYRLKATILALHL